MTGNIQEITEIDVEPGFRIDAAGRYRVVLVSLNEQTFSLTLEKAGKLIEQLELAIKNECRLYGIII